MKWRWFGWPPHPGTLTAWWVGVGVLVVCLILSLPGEGRPQAIGSIFTGFTALIAAWVAFIAATAKMRLDENQADLDYERDTLAALLKIEIRIHFALHRLGQIKLLIPGALRSQDFLKEGANAALASADALFVESIVADMRYMSSEAMDMLAEAANLLESLEAKIQDQKAKALYATFNAAKAAVDVGDAIDELSRKLYEIIVLAGDETVQTRTRIRNLFDKRRDLDRAG